MRPLVSILIPAFNSEAWIAETLRSAIAQTWDRKEIILVDDGSKDQTLAIARKYESETVRIITQENQGASAARNKAYSLSKGDYIQYLDHDDLIAPDKIERQIESLSQRGSERTLLSCRWGHFMYRQKKAIFVPTALWCDLSPTEFLLRKMEHNLFMQTSVWLVSRQLSEEAGAWDTRMLTDDDGEYFCRVLLACDEIRFVSQGKTYWRRSGTAQGSYIGSSDKKKESLLLTLQLHIQYLRSLDRSERSRRACLTFLQNWYSVFYPERPDLVEELQKLASELQGQLEEPHLSRKYAWMRPLFGWNATKRVQNTLPQIKADLLRQYDWAMHRMESSLENETGVMKGA